MKTLPVMLRAIIRTKANLPSHVVTFFNSTIKLWIGVFPVLTILLDGQP
jgi:hypothetical protein